MEEIAPGIRQLDTMMGGWGQLTAGFLVDGPQPALVETGARTSVDTVRRTLDAAGLGADDLRWLVLTHIHLDHAGGIGDLAAAFPSATVVVHERGARHLADPTKLIDSAARVYGPLLDSLYGRMQAVPQDRLVAAADGHRINLGNGRVLTLVNSPGHAKHHHAVLDEQTGTLLVGDAVGVRLPDVGVLRPAVPPPDFDLEQAVASLHRFAALRPTQVVLTHYGPVPDPLATLDEAERLLHQWVAVAEQVMRDSEEAGVGDIAAALADHFAEPPELADEPAREKLELLNGFHSNAAGIQRYLRTRDAAPRRVTERRVPLLPAVVLSVCLGLIGGAAAAWGIYQHYGPVERVVTQAPTSQTGSQAPPASVGAVATSASPSVVKVLTQPVAPSDLLAQPKGFAVGFVASSDGLVVTSAHALEGATQLRVALPDGRLFDAVVAGADVAHGIAVLRAVGAADLPALGFAAAAARPGDLAVAVGAPPFGGVSVTSGTVSSVGRSLSIPAGGTTTAAEVLDAITVDATPDPQDDGGPLLDAAAQVVGVVVTVSGTSALPGVVALSGRDAAALVDRLSHGGTSQRPTFGVVAVLLDPATAAAAGLPRGALVRSVVPAGPADKAGLVKGDVVTAVNGVAVDADHPLDPAALGVESGQTVSLSLTRDRQQLTVAVTVVDGAA